MVCKKCKTRESIWCDGLCTLCHYIVTKQWWRAKDELRNVYYPAGVKSKGPFHYPSNEGWSIRAKLCFVGSCLAVLKASSLNASPKTSLKLTDFYSDFWVNKILG